MDNTLDISTQFKKTWFPGIDWIADINSFDNFQLYVKYAEKHFGKIKWNLISV